MKNIAIFTGNRAEWGLLKPLAYGMKHGYKDFDIQVIVSGAHLSPEFGETKKYISDEFFPVEVPILMDGDDNTAVTQSMGMGLIQYPAVLTKMKPDCIIVFGDRYESLTMAIAAYNQRIPIAHIQGDDETLGSLDNGYRKAIRALATYHFDVKDYGSLCCNFPILDDIDVPCDYLVVYHPNGNIKELSNIIKAIKYLPNVVFIKGNCDAGGRENNDYLGNANAPVITNVSRERYLQLLKQAKVIIGNSSSGITEAPSFDTATVNVGDRQKGRIRASSVLDCDGTVEGIREAITKAMEVKFPVANPYYIPNTVQNIINDLRKYLNM